MTVTMMMRLKTMIVCVMILQDIIRLNISVTLFLIMMTRKSKKSRRKRSCEVSEACGKSIINGGGKRKFDHKSKQIVVGSTSTFSYVYHTRKLCESNVMYKCTSIVNRIIEIRKMMILYSQQIITLTSPKEHDDDKFHEKILTR